MMTKTEERAALTKIEKIIATAGPESYIGFAFEGCCEMALSNIDNDFANSPKQSITTLRKNLESEMAAREKLEAENRELRKKAAQIPAGLYKRLWLLVSAEEDNASAVIKQTGMSLAAMADCPSDISVAHNLKALQKAYSRKAEASSLLAALEELEPEGI